MLARATPAEFARIPRIRAEFRPWRPLAFELQRRGYAAQGWVLPGSSASVLHGRWPSRGVAEKARIGRDLFRSEDDPPAAKPATPLLSLRWTFRANRACVVITDAKPDRLAPLTPPAPMGLRGVWVVAARCCASPPARCCADALERSFACPSANLRAPSRRGLRPRSVRRQPAAVSPRGERTRSRRGCWHCCADRAAPRSPPSRAPPAGNRTRCAPSWPPWCARGSGSGWSRRRRTASACIGLLPARRPATAPPQTRHGARSRLSRPAPQRQRRLRWLRLAGRDLSEPVRHRPRHHRHRLEWSSVLCPRPCKQPRMRKPKTIGVGCASLLERLSQTGSDLLSDCAPCRLLECRAHRVAADQQGHRQSPAPAAH